MNQRNVDAIAKALSESLKDDSVGEDPAFLRSLAGDLASRGCLGPASEVLTDQDFPGDWHPRGVGCDTEHTPSMSNLKDFSESLERIAKGEIP